MSDYKSTMVVSIDATNLRQGGGRTHLIELLRAADPREQGIERVIVWGSKETMGLLDDRPWLEKVSPVEQEGGLVRRTLWQRYKLSKAIRKAGSDILFVPGGSYGGDFHTVVTMSQNMLPFERTELMRYGWSVTTIKLVLLRLMQTRTYQQADGIVFLTEYAKVGVEKVTGKLFAETAVIPHGMSDRFVMEPRPQKPIGVYSAVSPYRILYVSIIDQYKHQWKVVEAVAKLREQTGWPLVLELVGPSYPPALKRLQKSMATHDEHAKWVRYHGVVAYDVLHGIYAEADLGLFASSCENMPIIQLETMAAGLPVASSNRGPMPEILGDAGVYFNPEQPDSIGEALIQLIQSPELRSRLAQASFEKAQAYSWERCARDTFGFLVKVYFDKKESR